VFYAKLILHKIKPIYFCMYIVPQREHSVRREDESLYIDKELVQSKIVILQGRGSENNRLLLEISALEGSLIKYDLFKKLKVLRKDTNYPTVSRRVDDLVRRGYMEVVGKRTIIVGKRKDKSPSYGLTWGGFIAGLTSGSVAKSILRVLEKNPQLQLPFPRKPVFRIIREIFSDEELSLIAQSLLIGYLRAIPKDIEYLRPEQYLTYLLPAITEAPEIRKKFEQKDLSRLLQIPEVFEFFNKSLSDFERMLEKSLSGIKELRRIYLARKPTRTSPIVSKN